MSTEESTESRPVDIVADISRIVVAHYSPLQPTTAAMIRLNRTHTVGTVVGSNMQAVAGQELTENHTASH